MEKNLAGEFIKTFENGQIKGYFNALFLIINKMFLYIFYDQRM